MDGMNASSAVVAGIVSSLVFAGSALPMLVKAHRTKDLHSYSLGNLVLINAGNAIHTVYVASLPFGPIWFLHTFYTVSSLTMLGYYLRHTRGHRDLPPAALAVGSRYPCHDPANAWERH